MHDWANHARAASFTCVLFCAIVLTFSIYHPGIEWDDSDGIRDYRQKVGCSWAVSMVYGDAVLHCVAAVTLFLKGAINACQQQDGKWERAGDRTTTSVSDLAAAGN
jgi:hypothetical protein